MQDIKWMDVKTKREAPVAGGYVMQVIAVKDYPEYNYLELTLDIIEGKYKGYGYDTVQRTNENWGYQRLKAYYHTDKTKEAFRKMLDVFESENDRFEVATFNNNEENLVGLKIGVVMDEDDYNDYFSVKPNFFKVTTLDKIRAKRYRVKYLTEERKAELDEIKEKRKAEKEQQNSPAMSKNAEPIPF